MFNLAGSFFLLNVQPARTVQGKAFFKLLPISGSGRGEIQSSLPRQHLCGMEERFYGSTWRSSEVWGGSGGWW